MSSKVKILKWINDNLVLLVGIPLIIGVHYGWSRLQEIPSMVDQSKKKELPIIGAFKAFKDKIAEKRNFITGSSTTSDPQEK